MSVIDPNGIEITWCMNIISLTTPTASGKGTIHILEDSYFVTLFGVEAIDNKNALVILEEVGKDPLLTYMFEYTSRRDFSSITLKPYKSVVSLDPTLTYIAQIRNVKK